MSSRQAENRFSIFRRLFVTPSPPPAVGFSRALRFTSRRRRRHRTVVTVAAVGFQQYAFPFSNSPNAAFSSPQRRPSRLPFLLLLPLLFITVRLSPLSFDGRQRIFRTPGFPAYKPPFRPAAAFRLFFIFIAAAAAIAVMRHAIAITQPSRRRQLPVIASIFRCAATPFCFFVLPRQPLATASRRSDPPPAPLCWLCWLCLFVFLLPPVVFQ